MTCLCRLYIDCKTCSSRLFFTRHPLHHTATPPHRGSDSSGSKTSAPSGSEEGASADRSHGTLRSNGRFRPVWVVLSSFSTRFGSAPVVLGFHGVSPVSAGEYELTVAFLHGIAIANGPLHRITCSAGSLQSVSNLLVILEDVHWGAYPKDCSTCPTATQGLSEHPLDL